MFRLLEESTVVPNSLAIELFVLMINNICNQLIMGILISHRPSQPSHWSIWFTTSKLVWSKEEITRPIMKGKVLWNESSQTGQPMSATRRQAMSLLLSLESVAHHVEIKV
ncbi:hypothetical protein OUZ56_028693 [Daphnia magna]|uniref:Uncharacterized protein n=1 Tax=Daphnia magna TaxID=35525 RepID=A0ABR0B4M2_9CRUS|nr:hypothetical protein OUZ56_028693 [Daphnia magna]